MFNKCMYVCMYVCLYMCIKMRVYENILTYIHIQMCYIYRVVQLQIYFYFHDIYPFQHASISKHNNCIYVIHIVYDLMFLR